MGVWWWVAAGAAAGFVLANLVEAGYGLWIAFGAASGFALGQWRRSRGKASG